MDIKICTYLYILFFCHLTDTQKIKYNPQISEFLHLDWGEGRTTRRGRALLLPATGSI